MQNSKIQISIIIVNYKVERELVNCISSIIKSKPKVSYEIIVVDNDQSQFLKDILKDKFPAVKYIESAKNIGYGVGNNLGVKASQGDFLLFLNPDTVIIDKPINVLCNFMINNPKSGMVAPLLLDTDGKAYSYQGSDAYTLISAVVVLSFINKIFPNNPISSRFFHKNWNKEDIEEFDVVPGTAFMIKRNIFEKAGGFDKRIFLYFEEYDLAKKIKKLGYKNYIVPQSKVIHIWEASTKKRRDIKKIFAESRNLFFRKHYGMFFASIINLVSNIGKYEFALSSILATSVFLGLFKIRELMTFIGDQGWFYLSARDAIVNGQIPLVGIASSHPWLHQGSFWTYLLISFLWLFNFDPISGAYLTIFLGILSVIGIYILGSTLFGKRVGIIASLLYATSPLAVYYMRFPYHTSPIPLFTIALIFSLYKIIQNNLIYLPLSVFLLSILYNFEIATAVLWVVVVGVTGHKFLKREIKLKEIVNKKILALSVAGLIVPLLPMILYDIRNGFPQTLKFIIWILYKSALLFGYNRQHEFSIDRMIKMFSFLLDNFRKLVFIENSTVSLIIFICAVVSIVYFIFKKKKKVSSYSLIFFLFFIPLLLIILNQVPSDAYLPVLFPTGIFLVALFLDGGMRIKRTFIPALIAITIIVVSNVNFMLGNNFMLDRSSSMLTFDNRLQASRKVLNIAGNKDYNLEGRGPGSEYKSFIMNYEYLTWWLGKAPSKKNEPVKIYLSESANGIKIEKLIDKNK